MVTWSLEIFEVAGQQTILGGVNTLANTSAQSKYYIVIAFLQEEEEQSLK